MPSLYRGSAPENSDNIQSVILLMAQKFHLIDQGNLNLDIKGGATIKVAGNAEIEATNITLKEMLILVMLAEMQWLELAIESELILALPPENGQ